MELLYQQLLELSEKEEEANLATQLERLRAMSSRALARVLKEAEEGLQEELDEKNTQLEKAYKTQLAEEGKNASEDSGHIAAEQEKKRKEKVDKRVKDVWENAKKDEELVAAREKHQKACKNVQKREKQVEAARKQLA